MSPQDWNTDLSVGIKELNAEHRELLALFNALEETLQESRERPVVDKILGHLAAFTGYHCASEEDMLQQAGYPDLEKHRAEHRQLQQKVTACKESHEKGQLVAEDVVQLRDWYCDHIRNMDRLYGPFLSNTRHPREDIEVAEADLVAVGRLPVGRL